MVEPLISVVVPAYNYAHTLRRAVKSVLAQKNDDIELLVINDGSTDNTDELVSELLEEYPGQFSYLKTENFGSAATRNTGVRETSGSYLVFLDADDELRPGAVVSFKSGIAAHPNAKMLCGGHVSIDDIGRERYHRAPIFSGDPCVRLKEYLVDKKIALSNGAVLIHRAVFEKYIYPERFRSVEDIPMFSYILVNYETIGLDKMVVNIYKHADSLRHNVEYAKKVGFELIDEVFHEDRMPSECQSLKKQFYVRRALSLFRTLHQAEDYSLSLYFYGQAAKQNIWCVLKWKNLKKALHAFWISRVLS